MDFNRRYGRTGHLFQGRFHSTPMDENHYWTALRYVERNPLHAGLTKNLENWQFCSASAHLTGMQHPIVPLELEAWEARFGIEKWKEFLELQDAAPDRETRDSLRRLQASGKPLGAPEWIKQLEQRYERKLSWSPPGRPPRAATSVSLPNLF